MEQKKAIRLAAMLRDIDPLVKNKTNPFHKSKYADLNALLDIVRKPAEDHGFMVLQPINEMEVVSMIIDIETGSTVMKSSLALPDIGDPQKIGSAITYYRRYTLQSMLGISAQDDDGQGAKPKPKAKKQVLKQVQYEQLCKPENFQHIEKYLKEFDMSRDWREHLESLINVL